MLGSKRSQAGVLTNAQARLSFKTQQESNEAATRSKHTTGMAKTNETAGALSRCFENLAVKDMIEQDKTL